jgi:hypothetical protein
MARVILAAGLKGISGKIGSMVFRTYKNGHVHVHKASEKWHRVRPATENELANRRRFAFVSRLTAQIQHSYEWADAAARDRKRIREIVQYQYDKLLAQDPTLSEEELKGRIWVHYAKRIPCDCLDNVAKKRQGMNE